MGTCIVLNKWKTHFLPTLVYRYYANSIKIPEGFIIDINKPILKFVWKGKGPRIPGNLVFNIRNPVPKASHYPMKLGRRLNF